MHKKCKLNYKYYIGKNYISIFIILEEDVSWEERLEYFAFNISRKTGKAMAKNEMLKALGIKSSTFHNRTQKAIKKYCRKNNWNKINKSVYKKAISKKNAKKAIPWVNEKGKLCWLIKSMVSPAGADLCDKYGTC